MDTNPSSPNDTNATEKPRRVLLYGKSVILGTLEASLKRHPQMEICVLSAPFPMVEELKAMAPDVILFDVAAPRPEAAFALLETFPGLLLIGVDASRDEMLVLTSHPVQALAVRDLVHLILEASKLQGRNSQGKQIGDSLRERIGTE
jgi:hypothetical protein